MSDLDEISVTLTRRDWARIDRALARDGWADPTGPLNGLRGTIVKQIPEPEKPHAKPGAVVRWTTGSGVYLVESKGLRTIKSAFSSPGDFLAGPITGYKRELYEIVPL